MKDWFKWFKKNKPPASCEELSHSVSVVGHIAWVHGLDTHTGEEPFNLNTQENKESELLIQDLS